LYRQGIDLHCPSAESCDLTWVRPFPVIICTLTKATLICLETML
jgi:hypothetical protein